MSRLIFLFISLFCLSAAVPAVAATSNANQSSTPKTPNKPIIVRSSTPEITFSLPSNRTTGFSWFLLSYDARMVVPLSFKYIVPNKKIMGSSGVSYWAFRIRERAFLVPTVTKITMIYGRPWDMSETKTKVITIITRR